MSPCHLPALGYSDRDSSTSQTRRGTRPPGSDTYHPICLSSDSSDSEFARPPQPPPRSHMPVHARVPPLASPPGCRIKLFTTPTAPLSHANTARAPHTTANVPPTNWMHLLRSTQSDSDSAPDNTDTQAHPYTSSLTTASTSPPQVLLCEPPPSQDLAIQNYTNPANTAGQPNDPGLLDTDSLHYLQYQHHQPLSQQIPRNTTNTDTSTLSTLQQTRDRLSVLYTPVARLTDTSWNSDRRFNLPRGFLASHPSIQTVKKADPHLLPTTPICPGPYLHLYPPRLQRPSPTQTFRDTYPTEADLYDKVTAHHVPNYLGHHDQQVIIFMMYGWPTSYMGDQIPTLDLTNHISATKHPAQVKKFIRKETRLTALMGPFPNTPFTWTRTNTLMARPKKESTDMRIILDLSFPDLRAVNSHIPKVLYEGSPYKLKLPTPLDFSELIVQLGAGAYIYKVDLERAYR